MNLKSLKGPISDSQYQEINFFRKGGMGEIYSTIDLETGIKKAIKIVPIQNDEEYGLLKTEFDISMSLRHKNVIKTEFFHEFQEAGVKYIYCVMPFYENGSLREFFLKQKEKLSIKESLKLLIEISEGLEYAHSKVIHRDLKPENILIGDNSELQICDFGLAKLIDAKTRTRTFKGSGTLPYMAPECWVFDSNTISMDIYSLGIIFYEILTLELPFDGRNESEFRDKHLYEALPNLSNKRVDIPLRLIEVISKMTNKRQIERYNSMNEIVSRLKEITLNIEEKKDSNIDILLKKANHKITANQQEELIRQKEQELIDNELKFLDFSKKEVFKIFSSRIEELNKSLEREKIRINGNHNNFNVGFMNKTLSINYFSNSDIPNMLQRRKREALEYQKKKYRMVMQDLPPTHLEKDNVILIGKATLNYGNYKKESWGYNLLLRRANSQDLYGEWWVVWFNDGAFMNRYPSNEHYALDIPEFYEEYEFGRGNVMHVRNMELNTLASEGIDGLIGKILD